MRTNPGRSTVLFLVAVAGMLAVSTGGGEALGKSSAAEPVQNGRIYFDAHRNQIHSVLPDGTGEKTLVKLGFSPSASPADGRVAFDEGLRCYSVNSKGKDRKYLAGGKGLFCQTPTFSPNGRMIAFSGRKSNSDTLNQLYVVSTNGGKPRALTSGFDFTYGGPSFTPNGKSVIYTDGDQARIAAVDGSSPPRDLTSFPMFRGHIASVDLSPDGETLAFKIESRGGGQSQTGLYRSNRDGSEMRRIQSAPLSSRSGAVSISPDGRKVAFASPIYVARLSGGGKPHLVTPDKHYTPLQFSTSSWDAKGCARSDCGS